MRPGQTVSAALAMIWLLPITLLIFIILAGLWLLLTPELARLAQRNWQQRQTLLARQTALAERSDDLDKVLQAFRRVRSTRSRESFDKCAAHIQAARSQLKKAAQPAGVYAQIPAGQAPALFFLNQWQQAAYVPRNSLRLRAAHKALQAATSNLDAAETEWNNLNASAERLRVTCQKLTVRKLPHLRDGLDELAAHDLQLSDLNSRLGDLTQEALRIEESLRLRPDAPIRLLDELDVELDKLELALDALTAELDGLERSRQQMDKEMQAARERLAVVGAQPVALNDSRAFLQRAELLLQEAAQLRQQRQWQAATERVAVSQKLADLVTTLNEVDQSLAQISAVQHQSRFSQAIDNLANQYNVTFHEAHVLLLGPERGALTELGRRIGRSAADLAAIREEARALLASHQSDLRRAQQQAESAGQHLTRAWQGAQGLVLLHQDPLNESYASLNLQRTAAEGRPAELEAYVTAANNLADRLQGVEKAVRGQLSRIEPILSALPDHVAYAERQAARWPCLGGALSKVQECADRAHKLRQEMLTRGRLEDTMHDMEQIKGLATIAYRTNQRSETLVDRLHKLEADIDACLATTRLPAEQQSAARYMVQYHRDKAHTTTDPNQALDSLQEAYRFARQLVA